ncbi:MULTISPECIES: YczE/YyaS/YitT family protein [Bacillaceae]|uniref:YczE/YyaS/YitT family protein n=1 Tax=Bacillaceae TaxID=186817 RepID=UPI001C568611|nr:MULTISPECIES: YitT family protein [Rossellomorea]MBW3110681.1 YitT family protein [Bacillus sp. MCCB 382]MDX8343341.1 YitT family protein [Rossellomorea sp. YZS02]
MKIHWQISYFVIGLLIFSYGISMSIKVQYLGIHPWDVLNIAMFQKFGLTIGTWNIIVGAVLVSATLILKGKYVQIGTILNGVLVGMLVDFFLFYDLLPPQTGLITDIPILLSAILLMGVGGGLYSAAHLGTGPRDGFMLTISDLTGLSISRVRIICECTILLIGLFLSGPVFVFTFIYTFIQSPIFQRSFLFFTNRLHTRFPKQSNISM